MKSLIRVAFVHICVHSLALSAVQRSHLALTTHEDSYALMRVGTNRSASGSDDGGSDGPATLADYCSGAETAQEQSTKMKEGTKVQADWEDYGTMYPGKVTDKNSDGTVDIKYDDGFSEKRVTPNNIKVVKTKKETNEKTSKKVARQDPACKLLDFLEKLKIQLKDLNKMMAEWVGAQRAKVVGEKAKPTPPPSVKVKAVGAPAPAVPASEEETEDLEKLKAQLADREEYIKELEKQVAENDEALEKKAEASGAAAPPGVLTVDDLIKQYKAKIAERDNRIQELLKRIKEQEAELAAESAKQLSLKDIEAAVSELEKDVQAAKYKRDKLEEKGELDPELRAILDSIIKALNKMRAKIDNLLMLQAKAEADRKAAEREADEAAAAAKKKAMEKGESAEAAEKAAEVAKEDAKRKSSEKTRKADLEAMQAAQEVSKEMKEAEEGAKKLDTGLHPHGQKWWRYRHERSYIEALLMIFISILMLLWDLFFADLRKRVHLWAAHHADGAVVAEDDDEDHGAVYITWLRNMANQMTVCIFVFITLWLISKTSLIDYFPVIIKPQEDLRVPNTGAEYRQIAVDICTIFFFAIIFYFSLMISVAARTDQATHELEEIDAAAAGRSARFQRRKTVGATDMARQTFGAVVAHEDHLLMRQQLIVRELEANADADGKRGETVKKISDALDGDFSKFPIAKYLISSVRSTVTAMFGFGWIMWLPTICLFFALTFLHRFAHLGYVRIMGVAGIVVLVIILGMSYLTKKVVADEDERTEETPQSQQKTIHNKLPTHTIVLGLLQFSLFFVCYGVARMICQPWMWELHFWPVFYLTILAVLSAVAFVFLVAPAIPIFCMAMALPPHLHHSDWQNMLAAAEKAKFKPASARNP